MNSHLNSFSHLKKMSEIFASVPQPVTPPEQCPIRLRILKEEKFSRLGKDFCFFLDWVQDHNPRLRYDLDRWWQLYQLNVEGDNLFY